MNQGRVVVGVSTVLAVVAAIAFGVELASSHEAPLSERIQGPRIGVCGSPAAATASGRHSMAASFLIKNTSDLPVVIHGLRPTNLVNLASARVTVAKGADPRDIPSWRVGAAVGVPADVVSKSSSIKPDGSTILAAHSYATVITSMALARGAKSGSAAEFNLTTEAALGGIDTEIIHVSVGLGITSSDCSFPPQ
jgi:hypothetical protein